MSCKTLLLFSETVAYCFSVAAVCLIFYIYEVNKSIEL